MKYIKRFNESTKTKVFNQSAIDDCKDILLELEDKGFKTNIHSYFSSGVMCGKENKKDWISFFFNREKEFDYSDIEDVVERLKSYLSEFGLHINWMSPKERKEQKPTIQTTSVMNPMTFTPDVIKTRCELYFS